MEYVSPFGIPSGPGGGTPDPFALLRKPLSRAAVAPATPLPGKPVSVEPSIISVRELERMELVAALVEAERPAAMTRLDGQAKPPAPVYSTRKIRAWHHEVARMLASGFTDKEVATALECSMTTIGTLKKSPAFQELLIAYSHAPDEQAFSAAAKIRATAMLALEKTEEILANPPEGGIPLPWLRDVLFPLLDRAGFSPVNKSVSVTTVNQGVSAEFLQRMKEELSGTTIIMDAASASASASAKSEADKREPPTGDRAAVGPTGSGGGPAEEPAQGRVEQGQGDGVSEKGGPVVPIRLRLASSVGTVDPV